jgi:ankyrin repeat protein
MAKYLIDKGANVKTKNLNEMTPLHSGTRKTKPCVILLILLFKACEKGHLEIVEFLIENGVELEAKDDEGLTPLHYGKLRISYV